MFMDYILESETGYSYGVSQETMDEIDNIEIPTNLSEYAGLSPFECISKANYEKFGARQVDKVIDDIVTPVIVDAWYHGESCVSIQEISEN